MIRLSGRRWAVVAAASGTVLIGGGAFWLSFTALADLAVRSGITAGQAWIWPLLVDGLIVVATVAVVALDGHRTAWYPWMLLIAGALMSVSANAAHALVAAHASVPALLAASVASVPPLVLLAATHLTVVLTRSTKTPEPSTITPAGAPAPPDPVDADVRTGRRELSERAAPLAGIAARTPPALSAAPLTPVPEPVTPGDGAPEATAEPDPAAPAPPTGGREAERGRRERAEELREAGWSNKAIAREIGVHASTIGRWFPRTDPALDAGPETSADAEQKEHNENKEQRS